MNPATPASAGTGDDRVAPRAGVRGSLLAGATGLVARLPEAPLVAAAEAAGELWYRVSPARADQARANLRRVCEDLAATGRGSVAGRRAAGDEAALERLVRAAFRHAARYYLEVILAGRFDPDSALARIDVETPAEVEAALAGGQPIVLVGMHFGAIELPVVYLASRFGHRVTAPMELVDDPVLRRWFVETRGRLGIDIIPLAGARHRLQAALRSGCSVGLVADRDLTGGGLSVPFFGHPAPMPGGPALLALEAGVPVYVGAARRTRGGRYGGRLVEVPPPGDGSRRERLTAMTARIADAMAGLIGEAPEQWWGAFHPIWPDLDPARPRVAR